jgi:hypothetical protein
MEIPAIARFTTSIRILLCSANHATHYAKLALEQQIQHVKLANSFQG